MRTFNANTPTEKWLKHRFETKTDAAKSLGISRPTLDSMCKNTRILHTYLHRLAKVLRVKPTTLLKEWERYGI